MTNDTTLGENLILYFPFKSQLGHRWGGEMEIPS